MKSEGWIGMGIPNDKPNRQRWAEAAPKMAMALSEAGYPTRFKPMDWGRKPENELVFSRFPPPEVVMRAATLCGVADLVEAVLADLGNRNKAGTT